MALMVIGAVLLLPPVAGIFLIDGTIADLPIPMLYVFAVWIILIAAAAMLSRSLRQEGEPAETTEASEGNN
jgi:hypothetical protein